MARAMTEEQRLRRNERAREWRRRNIDHCKRRDQQRYLRTKGETQRAAALKYKFGITLEDYDGLVLRQAGLCLICERPETATRNGKVKRLAVDHCHRTNEVRGLLCSRCNQALGLLGEDVRRMENMIEYVKEHDESRQPVC